MLSDGDRDWGLHLRTVVVGVLLAAANLAFVSLLLFLIALVVDRSVVDLFDTSKVGLLDRGVALAFGPSTVPAGVDSPSNAARIGVAPGAVHDVVVAADSRCGCLGQTPLEAVLEHPDLAARPGLSPECRRGLVPFDERRG